MEGFPKALIEQDFAAFPTQDPKISAARKAEEVKRSNDRKSKARKPTKQDIETAHEISEKMTAEQEADVRQQKLRKINLYYQHLGHKINYKPKTKPNGRSSVAYLDEIIFNIETDLGVGQGMDLACEGYAGAMKGLEKVTHFFNPLGLRLSGPAYSLSSTVEANRDSWKDLMTEFAIKYESWFTMSVEKRILFFSFQMISTVHAANSLRMAEATQATASEKVKEAAEGL